MDQQRRMNDVSALVGERQTSGVRLEKLYMSKRGQAKPGVGEYFRSNVTGQELKPLRPAAAGEEGREVSGSGAHVDDHGALRSIQQPLDRAPTVCGAAGKAVEHRHFAQVATQLDDVEAWLVEIFARDLARMQCGDHGAHRLRAQTSVCAAAGIGLERRPARVERGSAV